MGFLVVVAGLLVVVEVVVVVVVVVVVLVVLLGVVVVVLLGVVGFLVVIVVVCGIGDFDGVPSDKDNKRILKLLETELYARKKYSVFKSHSSSILISGTCS